MKDYIKEGLQKRLAPPAIYENICRALENDNLTEEEREDLLRQKAKAGEISSALGDLFKL